MKESYWPEGNLPHQLDDDDSHTGMCNNAEYMWENVCRSETANYSLIQLFAASLPLLKSIGFSLSEEGANRANKAIRYWAGLETSLGLSIHGHNPASCFSEGIDDSISLSHVMWPVIRTEYIATQHFSNLHYWLSFFTSDEKVEEITGPNLESNLEADEWERSAKRGVFEFVRGVSNSRGIISDWDLDWGGKLLKRIYTVIHSIDVKPTNSSLAIATEAGFKVMVMRGYAPVVPAVIQGERKFLQLGRVYRSGRGKRRIVEGYCIDTYSMLPKYLIRDIASGAYDLKTAEKAHEEYTVDSVQLTGHSTLVCLPKYNPVSNKTHVIQYLN